MKSLLIYNDSITSESFVNEFKTNLGNAFSFRISNATLNKENFSFDQFATDFLLQVVPNNEYDVIFLPYNLSNDNYLEFSGLQLAYHIRLTTEFLSSKSAIVFYGTDNPNHVSKLTKSGQILYTHKVYFTKKIDIKSFISQVKYITNNPSDIDINRHFINKIDIKPSGNYKTHHAISNEWSILRWAKTLNVDTSEIDSIEKKIGFLLYYKYLNAKYPLTKKAHEVDFQIKNKGKILFIDDELENGWNSIFKNICKNQEFESIGNEFKGMNQEDIINESFNKAIKFELVVLDLRLHDDDFGEGVAIENITGYKILKKIKEHNKGIQVIIFSATNKIWNLQALQKAEADGFIIKESPENSQEPDFTKKSIENMIETIDGCLEMKFLKEVYNEILIINNVILKTENERNISLKELKKEIKSSLKTAIYLSRSKHTLDFALLNYIKILEQYCNFFTEFNKTTQKAIVYKNRKDKLDKKNEVEIYKIMEVIENNQPKKIIQSNYTYEKGFYDFQTSKKNNEMQFINYKTESGQYDDNSKFFSLSLKLVAVLNIQLNDVSKTRDLMELIYIRNNKLAHKGNLDDIKRKVTVYDIELIFNVLIKLIKKCL
jgi:CheY-like chemotaxis protein